MFDVILQKKERTEQGGKIVQLSAEIPIHKIQVNTHPIRVPLLKDGNEDRLPSCPTFRFA